MRVARKTSLLTGLALAAALLGLSRLGRPTPPNVVLVVIDTLRADAISYAPGNAETPVLARLAGEAVPFEHAFAHAPMTLPAHAALFSGRLPHATGVVNNGQRVPAELPLLTERFAARGYRTRAVLSLATLWPEARAAGLDRGFERYDQGELEVSPASATTPRLDAALDGLDRGAPFFLFAHLADPHEPYCDGGASGRAATVRLDGAELATLATSDLGVHELALELDGGPHALELVGDEPFKLRAVSLARGDVELACAFREGAPQTPSERVRLAFDAREAGAYRLRLWLNDEPDPDEVRARYAAEVRRADAALGALLDGLRARGLYENTLIVVTADHGEALGEHGTQGHVRTLYDELLHVPLVVRLPRGEFDPRLAAAREELVRHVDLAPTLCELLDLEPLPAPDGTSLLHRAERTLLAQTHPPEAPRELWALRDARHKLVYAPAADAFELYDLARDPLELADVFADEGERFGAWQRELRDLAARGLAGPLVTRDDARVRARLSALGY
ncbi:MAG: sulfatase [Planctomycetes bacterium]|nr:sulfatase [Planctomycetota bacterium]